MLLTVRGLNSFVMALMTFFLMLLLPGAAHSENVVFEDSFKRADSSSPGPQWQEFRVRRAENGAIPVAGDTPWGIRGNTLYFEATGKNSYIEDFVQTAREYPVDNTRVEFEIRATGGTRLGYIGPTAFWAGGAEERRDAHNWISTGRPILGVQAWYRWENKGTSGVFIHGLSRPGDHPQLLFSGLNQSGFAKHVIIIQGGKLTYQSPDCPALTYELRTPLEPGATRRFSFGARLYDNGIKETIEIRNLKITSLDKTDPKLGDKAKERLNEEMAKLSAQLRTQVRSGLDPLVQQVLAKAQAALDTLGPQITGLFEPVLDQILAQIQVQAKTQMEAAQSMKQGFPQGGMPQIPGGVPSGLFPGTPTGLIPGGLPGSPGEILLAQAGPSQGPSMEQIMEKVTEQIRSQIRSEIQSRSHEQASIMKPQVDALVQSVIDPMMPEIEALAQAQAQSLAPILNNLVESNFNSIMRDVIPLLPPDVQKLPSTEIEALIRKNIDEQLKPQITAVIEEEVNSIVQEKILVPIQSKVTDIVRGRLATAKSKIARTVDSLQTGQLSALPIGNEVKNIILESLDSIEACVLSDVETRFRNSGPKKFLISVLVNGKQVSYDVLPVVQDGRTLVPLRAIAQSVGAQVQWNEQTQTISLSRGDKTVKLGIGETTATVNNQQLKLDVPATIVNGRTLVPARFIGESLGAQVNWDQSSKTASIVVTK